MATTAIATELLNVNTVSADLPFIAGSGSGNAIVATSTTDGWVITAPVADTDLNVVDESHGERLVLILGSDGSGGTITFKGGDRYPAQRADLGDLTVTLAANDGRVISIETSRFLKSDGTIVAIPSTTGLVMTAVMLVKGP